MGRIIQMSRNAILDIRAIMKQYEDDSGFKEEFDKLKYLSQKAIGFDSTIGSVQTQARKLDDSYTDIMKEKMVLMIHCLQKF